MRTADIGAVQVSPEGDGQPDQLENDDPPAAAAVRTTVCPAVKFAPQVTPQLMPAGDDVTVPVPTPALLTVMGNANCAVTFCAAVIVTTHAPAPEQPPPLQLKNDAPGWGVAVKVTPIPFAYDALQVGLQLIPAGDELTVPPVPPATVTDNG